MEAILHAFGIDWRLISIQIFNFALLAVLLWYFLYTPILNLLRERQEKIVKGIEDAEAAEASRRNAESERQTVLSAAQNKAEEIVKRGKEHADEKVAEILTQAETRANYILAEAKDQAETVTSNAVKESEAEVAKLAVLAAEKILKEKES